MKNTTPFLKTFGPLLFGRKAAPRLPAGEELGELYDIFESLIPTSLFERPSKGANSRQRTLPPEVTFWAFLSQALSPGSSCREVVRKLEAWWHWSGLNRPATVSESAYCQARKRLPKATLHHVFKHTGLVLDRNVLQQENIIPGRRVRVVDGTMLSMPDTSENQQCWPQSSGQKPGLGFPLLKMVSLFSLESGGMTDYAIGNLHQHESNLFRSLWPQLDRGDIVLGDRAFCSYGTLAMLQSQGNDGSFAYTKSGALTSGKAPDWARMTVW
jgi:hypothetical protein